MLQQIYVRYHRGQTKDERFAPFEFLAEGLFMLARGRRTSTSLCLRFTEESSTAHRKS